MKVLICSLLFSLFAITNLYSQHTSIKVNGLELGQAYTDSQIRDSLGNPTSVIPPLNQESITGVPINYRSKIGYVTILYNTLDNAIISIVGESPILIL